LRGKKKRRGGVRSLIFLRGTEGEREGKDANLRKADEKKNTKRRPPNLRRSSRTVIISRALIKRKGGNLERKMVRAS